MNELPLVASGEAHDSAIKINQDANIYIAELEICKQMTIFNCEGRQAYLVCLDGSLAGNGVDFIPCDAIKIWGKEYLTLTAIENSHILMVEMAIED